MVLTIALGFWGRQVLKLAKFKTGLGYGEPLTLAAALACFLFLTQAVYPFVGNYNLFFNLFFIVGCLGALCEIIILGRKVIKQKREKDFKNTIISIITSNEPIIIMILFSILISGLYSAIWHSGELDIWMNNGADFYNWIFVSEYFKGNINIDVFNINHAFYYLSEDAIGTYLILGLLSTINVKSVLLNASYSVVSIIVWQGTIIYLIISRKIGIKKLYSFILAVGVVLGALVNYIALFGLFGQMIAMVCFLAALEQLDVKSNKKPLEIAKKLFFPFFTLFISYQAGYLLYSFYVFIAYFIIIYIGTNNNNNNSNYIQRLTNSFLSALKPFLFIFAVSFVIMPGLAYHLFMRSLEVGRQTAGWNLPYLGPWFFSGLPFYQDELLRKGTKFVIDFKQKFIYYPLYIFFIVFMCRKVWKQSKIKINNPSVTSCKKNGHITFLLSFFVIYIGSLFFYYILAVFLTNNGYKTWKFVTFTALPLSFIPISLFILYLSGMKDDGIDMIVCFSL
jgi:hypothetical protein